MLLERQALFMGIAFIALFPTPVVGGLCPVDEGDAQVRINWAEDSEEDDGFGGGRLELYCKVGWDGTVVERWPSSGSREANSRGRITVNTGEFLPPAFAMHRIGFCIQRASAPMCCS